MSQVSSHASSAHEPDMLCLESEEELTGSWTTETKGCWRGGPEIRQRSRKPAFLQAEVSSWQVE